MNRKLFAGLILCLALMLVGALALAEGDELAPRFAQPEYNIEGFCVTPSDEIFASNLGLEAAIYIDNFNDLCAQLSGDPQWTLEHVSGEELTIINQGGSNLGWYFLDSVPDHPSEAVYRVTCAWDGHASSVLLNYTFRAFDMGQPAAGNFPDVIDTQVGETVTLEASFLPEGWTQAGALISTELVGGPFDYWTYVPVDGQPFRSYRMDKAGQYESLVIYSVGNVSYSGYVTFRVRDENGDLPGPRVALDFINGRGSDTPVYFLDVDDDMGSLIPDTLQQDPMVANIWLNDYEHVRSLLSGDPAFTCTFEGTARFVISDCSDNEQPFIQIDLAQMPAAPEEDVIHISCVWGDNTWEGTITVSFRSAAGLDLPNGVNLNYVEPLVMTAGEKFSPELMISLNRVPDIPEDDRSYVEAYLGHRQSSESVHDQRVRGVYRCS